MSSVIVSAAVCTDTDTGSYFELATRAGFARLKQAAVTADRIGMVVNTGVFRDSNISEPAVAALLQRLGIGLEYAPGQLPAFSFDLMNGGAGLAHALTTVQCFQTPGAHGTPAGVEYALVLAGDTHPSTDRDVEDFPYSAGAAAVLLHATADTRDSPQAPPTDHSPGSLTPPGFGRLYSAQPDGVTEPTAWVDLAAAGTNGRAAVSVRTGTADPLETAAAAVQACMAGESLDRGDFATGNAVLLTPAPQPGFREQLAYRLGIPSAAVAGVAPALGDPYTAAPVHAYLAAARDGLLDNARAVLFLAADDSSAACVAYRPQPLAVAAGSSARTKPE